MGIGMVKMRTIGLGIQSALSKKVVFGGTTCKKPTQLAVFSFNVFPSKTM